MLRKKGTSLGVDIGSSSIKAVELEYDSKGPSILSAGISEPLEDDSYGSASVALSELFGRKKFRTKRKTIVKQI